MKSPEFNPRPNIPPQEVKKETAEQKIIEARRVVADLEDFIDTKREELKHLEDAAARERILESMRHAREKLEKFIGIIEEVSGGLANEKHERI